MRNIVFNKWRGNKKCLWHYSTNAKLMKDGYPSDDSPRACYENGLLVVEYHLSIMDRPKLTTEEDEAYSKALAREINKWLRSKGIAQEKRIVICAPMHSRFQHHDYRNSAGLSKTTGHSKIEIQVYAKLPDMTDEKWMNEMEDFFNTYL